MKKMITAIASLLILACALPAWATDKQLTSINDIKKNREYLYGEATMPTLEEATSLAYEMLQKEVLDWAADRVSRPIENFSVKEVNRLADTIVTRRADMYRVFAYVKKLKLNTMFYDSGLVYLDSLDFGKINDLSPVPAEGAKRDTLSNEAIIQQIRSKLLPSSGEESRSSALPSSGEELRSSLLPSSGEPEVAVPDLTGGKAIEGLGVVAKKVIDRIRKARNFFDLKNVLPQLKQEGLISNYGKLATADHLEECLLIVYDAAGNIKALLGKGEETRPNLNTGKDDTLDNYRGCGALWVLVK